MKSIDIKSLLIGILGTLLVIACTAAKTNMRSPSKNGEPGTYAVACSGVASSHHCIVIDTRYGEAMGAHDLWRIK
jgi:hypothetical protein